MLKKSLAVVFALSIAVAGVSAQRGQRGAPPDGAQQQGGGRGGRGGRGGEDGAPAAPAQKPYVPTSAASLARNPAAYMGENVTVTASIEQILSKSAFVLEQHQVAASTPSAKAPTA